MRCGISSWQLASKKGDRRWRHTSAGGPDPARHTWGRVIREPHGRGRVQSGAGRILAVDAGPGARLFGLLNLRSLPQILSLDFGGFLDEGLGYDRISGTFTLDDGNAYTNNLRLATQTADINVAGRTGLVQEDYDQLVNVTPRLSDSLPVAGAAFGGVGRRWRGLVVGGEDSEYQAIGQSRVVQLPG